MAMIASIASSDTMGMYEVSFSVLTYKSFSVLLWLFSSWLSMLVASLFELTAICSICCSTCVMLVCCGCSPFFIFCRNSILFLHMVGASARVTVM